MPQSTEEQVNKAEKLKEIRRNLPKKFKDKAKFIADKASLMAQFNPFLDWMYGIALSAALLKDILDFTGIGSFPAIGTVITIMATMVIWFIMIITGSAFKAYNKRKLIKRYGVLAIGTIIELVFGIDFLPIETAMVVYIFISALEDRRDAKKATDEKSAS